MLDYSLSNRRVPGHKGDGWRLRMDGQRWPQAVATPAASRGQLSISKSDAMESRVSNKRLCGCANFAANVLSATASPENPPRPRIHTAKPTGIGTFSFNSALTLTL